MGRVWEAGLVATPQRTSEHTLTAPVVGKKICRQEILPLVFPNGVAPALVQATSSTVSLHLVALPAPAVSCSRVLLRIPALTGDPPPPVGPLGSGLLQHVCVLLSRPYHVTVGP